MRLFAYTIINTENHEVTTGTAWAENIADAFAWAQEYAREQWLDSRVSKIEEVY